MSNLQSVCTNAGNLSLSLPGLLQTLNGTGRSAPWAVSSNYPMSSFRRKPESMRIRQQVNIGLMAPGFRFKTGMTAQFDDTPYRFAAKLLPEGAQHSLQLGVTGRRRLRAARLVKPSWNDSGYRAHGACLAALSLISAAGTLCVSLVKLLRYVDKATYLNTINNPYPFRSDSPGEAIGFLAAFIPGEEAAKASDVRARSFPLGSPGT